MSYRSDQAASEFWRRLPPAYSALYGYALEHGDEQGKAVARLLQAAFALYEAAHKDHGTRYDIRQWKWPLTCLIQGDLDFGSDHEPWTVLLREAVWLAALGLPEKGART